MKNLFKTLGISLAAFGMAAAVGVGLKANDMKAASAAAVYTLTPVKGSNSGYKGNCDITCSNITWNVTGNANVVPWRIGGKSITSVDRLVYSKTALSSSVTSVELDIGASNITINSVTLDVSTKANKAGTVYSTLTESSVSANSTLTFEKPSTATWSNAYYTFTFNVTFSKSSNMYVEFKGARFNGGDSTSYKVTYDANDLFDVTVPTDSTEYSSGDSVSVLGKPSGFDDSNYTWLGWSLTSDGDVVSSFNISSNTTLYAKYTYNGKGSSASNAYTVNEAIGLIDSGKYPTKHERYVAGLATASSYDSQYKNYEITLEGSKTFTLFRAILNSSITEDLTAGGAFIGRDVVAHGVLKLYNETYELDSGCEIVSVSASKTLSSVVIFGTASVTEYAPGDSFNHSGLIATAYYSDSSSTDVTAIATWSCTPETLSLGDTSVSVVATFKEVASVAFQVNVTVTKPDYDLLDLKATGVTSGSSAYEGWTHKSASGASYTGNSAGGNASIQLRAKDNSGIVTTVSGGYAMKIVVEINSKTAADRTIQVYGKESAYSSTADLYSNATKGTLIGTLSKTTLELDVSNDASKQMPYIGLLAQGGAIYVTSIKIYWEEVTPTITSLTLSPADDTTIAVGNKKTFEASIIGTHLTGDEVATVNFDEISDVPGCFSVTPSNVKNGETITVTALAENGLATLSISCSGISSNKISLYTEAAKELSSLTYSGTYTSEYFEGDDFDPTGLKITANYINGSSADVTDYIDFPIAKLVAGQENVTVSYKEGSTTKECNIPVTVSAIVVTSINSWNLANDFSFVYFEGDDFDFTNLGSVAVEYNDIRKNEILDAQGIKEKCEIGLYTTSGTAGQLVTTISDGFKWNAAEHNGYYLWLKLGDCYTRKTTPITVSERINSLLVPQEAQEVSASFVAKDQGYTNGEVVSSWKGSDFSLTFNKESSNNDPAYYNTGTGVRLYPNNTLVVQSNTINITKIEFTFSGDTYKGPLSADVGNYAASSWTCSGEDIQKVTFVNVGPTGHARIQNIKVYWIGGSSNIDVANTDVKAQKAAITVAEAFFGDAFDGACGATDSFTMDNILNAFNNVKTIYNNQKNALDTESADLFTAMLKSVKATMWGVSHSMPAILEEAAYRYDAVMMMFGTLKDSEGNPFFEDFLGRFSEGGINAGKLAGAASLNSQLLTAITSNSSMTITALTVIIVTLSVSGYAVLSKRKKHN